MNIESLQHFVALAKILNFTEAARQLHVSQSTLSRQIARLESQVGQPLFVRSPAEVSLTPQGTRLVEYAESIVALHEEALRAVNEAGREAPTTVCVGGSLLLASVQNLLAMTTATLTAAGSRTSPTLFAPHSSMSFRAHGSHNHYLMALEGAVDVTFLCHNECRDFSAFDCLPLYREPLGFILRDDNPLSARTRLTLDDFRDESFVVPHVMEDFIFAVEEACRRRGFEPHIKRLSVDSPAEALLPRGVHDVIPSPLSSVYTMHLSSRSRLVEAAMDDPEAYVSVAAITRQDNNNSGLPEFLEALEATRDAFMSEHDYLLPA